MDKQDFSNTASCAPFSKELLQSIRDSVIEFKDPEEVSCHGGYVLPLWKELFDELGISND
jgi:hypothetical protein